jgi:ATP-dependent DNA helicase RecG
LDVVHGKMTAAEKEVAMDRFQQGDTQVLLATSVVEVGVDVANATVMTIEGGERFGLAQLHQLRGRIGRGRHPGYLCVFPGMPSDQARQRLEAFCACGDGFELAEMDFELRGPGSLFSLQQHGLPSFLVADLARDQDVLLEARAAAESLVGQGSFITDDQHARLRERVFRRYGRVLDLIDAG